MKIIKNNLKSESNKMLTLAIGNFDGVHLGHQELILETLKYNDTNSAVLTFYPHPIGVFTKNPFLTLTDCERKVDLISKMGVDFIYVKEFVESFYSLSVDDFARFLKSLNVKRVIVGADFRFASKGVGTANDLKQYFETVIIKDVFDEQHVRVSSSYIKSLLDSKQIDEANFLLTRPYTIKGSVVHGSKVGRTLGFPTANINSNNYYLPGNGVYYVNVTINNNLYYGLANVGNNPTINQTDNKRLEIYLLDFNKTIYNEQISCEFIKFIRDEIKFDSKELLIEQMKIDENMIRKYIFN